MLHKKIIQWYSAYVAIWTQMMKQRIHHEVNSIRISFQTSQSTKKTEPLELRKFIDYIYS